MEKLKEVVVQHTLLTEEEVKAIVPNIELDDDGKEIPKPKSAAELRKEAAQLKKKAEEDAFVAPRVVTEKGLPVTQAGMKRSFEIREEVDKRDPDMHEMYIYNDFAGYGVIEVMENVLLEFNEIIFKKEISPIEKWTIMEGLTTYLHIGDHMTWMMNDNSEAIEDVLNMMGIMFITALEMLHESKLIGGTSPLPDNVGIMTLLFLDFMSNTCSDFDLDWLHEIVRAADKYGVVLAIPEPKRIGVSQDQLDECGDECEERRMTAGLTWKTKKQHPGGDRYDITKMSKAEQARYKFSNVGDSGSGSEGDDDDE
ncbi:uncharacterized protein LY89DRAFT_742862 [Mollisia scopiformis]|uniref:Uncharacterized protein n=1 Tax=Mollisia scopiformis TaxID=149040 RepID=A0A132B6X8_MOLSC|nr:uncharacterized protein LY89DRAFT_742862 [Mollisia scopiformis]KUJ07634.1 hypothetical protein LY89DRAFT_742862 [Mollisia scopiformis]